MYYLVLKCTIHKSTITVDQRLPHSTASMLGRALRRQCCWRVGPARLIAAGHRAVGTVASSTTGTSQSDDGAVLYSVHDNGVATITLNDARRRNPLSHAVLQMLHDCVGQVRAPRQWQRAGRRSAASAAAELS